MPGGQIEGFHRPLEGIYQIGFRKIVLGIKNLIGDGTLFPIVPEVFPDSDVFFRCQCLSDSRPRQRFGHFKTDKIGFDFPRKANGFFNAFPGVSGQVQHEEGIRLNADLAAP